MLYLAVGATSVCGVFRHCNGDRGVHVVSLLSCLGKMLIEEKVLDK